ncbi:biopolymer transporter ExbD [Oceaniserpentilla sp. 4NH20-0058]|uniref:ExbD/TolR family protein n=1 Tax=Oceaniserpentilla sp. 4NH20-0058 TaxID=3127660 RepID=UPI00310AF714
MTTRRHQVQQDDSELDITPMLDIVFIMLIFFIVTTSFVKESGIEVNSPSAATSVNQDKASILIAINENSEVWIDKRQVDITTVRAIIARLHTSNPEGSVVIQADKLVSADQLMTVMDQVRQAGVLNIALAAQKK